MGIIRNSLVSGEVPAPSQMALTDIAINNADGALYIVKKNGTTGQMVQVGGITSFNQRRGDITLTSSDVTLALGYTPIGTNSPAFTGTPTAPTATPGANSTQIATTAFVTSAIANLHIDSGAQQLEQLTDVLVTEGASIDGYFLAFSNSQTKWVAQQLAAVAKTGSYSDLQNLPSLSAVATSGSYTDLANTPAPYSLPVATNTILGGVKAGNGVNITADGTLTVPTVSALSGLTDVNVTETAADDKKVLAFDKNSSKWVGLFLANAAYSGDYNDLINKPAATGVVSFNTRSGNVTLTSADLTNAGGALIESPTFTGAPAAPTATAGTNTTQIATTEFVTSAVSTAVSGAVTSFNTRTGAVTFNGNDITSAGGALLASPAFSGTPTAPTASAADNSHVLANTQFVKSAIANNSVTSFNTRLGPVTLTSDDVTTAIGFTPANIVSPAFSGTPTAPTPAAGDNSANLATTAFVATAISSSAVTSFNGRAGAVSLQQADIANAGGALLASPAFSGSPTAPTPRLTDSSTTLATTAFVQAQKYYDVKDRAFGAIAANQLIVQFVSGRTVTFPAGLTNSQGYAAVVPTASTTFTINANGTDVGTMVFAAGSNTATFTASSSFSLSPGQVLTVTAPASADATIASVSVTLLGLAS
jgi:hypothetical protein